MQELGIGNKWMRNMKNAIKRYYKQMKKYPDYYRCEDFSGISKDICEYFNHGTVPVEKKERTDVSCFKKEFGYGLPEEIDCYLNIYWHTCISGYCHTSECVVLFSVLKKEGDTADDILYYEHSLMRLARRWAEIGDIDKYIPIGWLGYSGGNVLYEVATSKIYLENMNADIDGMIEEKPIAHSLKELIKMLKIKNM